MSNEKMEKKEVTCKMPEKSKVSVSQYFLIELDKC